MDEHSNSIKLATINHNNYNYRINWKTASI